VRQLSGQFTVVQGQTVDIDIDFHHENDPSAPSSTAEIVTVSALQVFNGGGALFVVPLTQGSSTTLNVTTAAGTVDYNLSVPAQNPKSASLTPAHDLPRHQLGGGLRC
jgi:hypothetical protein